MARLLRWNLLVLLALAGLVTAWIGRGGESSAAMLATVFAATFLAPSVLAVLNTFVAVWLYGSPVPAAQRMGLLASLRFAAVEWLGYVFLFQIVQPFERIWLGEDRLRPLAPGTLPLLLVHGYGCNRGTWWWMRPRLEAAGYCVATVNLEPPLASIEAYGEVLRRRIDEVLAATGASRVVLIGHSMGGLASRVYLAQFGADRVAALLTLGTPHHGSRLAKLGLGANAREMEPQSTFLQRLQTAPRALPCGVTAFYSLHDNYVVPQSAQALPAADNRPLAGIGHLGLVFSRNVAALLLARLAEIAQASRAG